jgi:oligopeptide transport system substrate-binding protein
MMKRIVLLTVVSSLLTAGLFAAAQREPAATGNQLNIVLASEPNTIDPTLNTATDASNYIENSFEGLYTYADAGGGRAYLVPGQAEAEPSKTVNRDGTVTYLFKLRPGLKWSDGKALVAGEFVYSWRRLVDPKTAAQYSNFGAIVKNGAEITKGQKPLSDYGIRAVDDRTLEVTLAVDIPYFYEIIARPAFVPLREDIISKAGDQWTFSPSTYISNGPYQMKEWVHNSYILYTKNPNYRESIPGPDSLKFFLMSDANAMLAAYRNGEVDYLRNFPVDELPRLIASKEVTIADYLGTYFVTFQNQKPPFNDWRVRKAFTLAIDHDYIVNQITRSGEIAANAYIPFGFSDVAAGSDFRRSGKTYYGVDAKDYQANIAEAKRLLAEAGYPNGRGFPVVEYIYNTDNRHQAIGEALQNMWNTNLGVNVTMSNQDWAVFLDTRRSGNYQLARHGWIADYADAISMIDIFQIGNGNNVTFYQNQEFTRLLDQAKATTVQADRMRYMHQAEDLLMEKDWAVAPIYFYTLQYILRPKFKGFYLTSLGYFFFKNITGF